MEARTRLICSLVGYKSVAERRPTNVFRLVCKDVTPILELPELALLGTGTR